MKTTSTGRKSAGKFDAGLGLPSEVFGAIFDRNATIMSVVRLSDRRYVAVNEAWVRAFGIPRDEVVGRTVLELPHWDEVERGGRDEMYRTLGEQGRFRDIAVRRRAASGELVTLLVSGEVIAVPGDRLIVASAVDITEHKRSQEMLRRSEEKYRSLFNSLDEGFCVIEVLFDERGKPVDFRFLEINSQFEQQTGLANVVGKRIRELAPDNEEYWFEMYGRIALTGTPEQIENQSLGRWYDVYAWRHGRPEDRQVAVRFKDTTARMRAEAAVQDERDRLQALVNSMSDEVWFADAKGHLTLTNPAVAKEFGLAADASDEIAKIAASLEVLHADGTPRPIKESPLLLALKGKESLGLEEIIRTPAKGELRNRQLNCSPVRDRQGKVIGSVAVVRDITEMKRIHDNLARSEERLRLAMEAAQAGSWQANLATGEFSASERALAIHGLPPDAKMTQETAMANIVADDRPGVDAAVQHTMATGEALRLEHRVRWPDGTIRWVESYAQRRQEGERVVLAGFVRDITERRHMEDQLAESRALLELALSGAELGTWDTDIASGRSHYDARYCAMLGYTPEELDPTMETWMALVHPDDQMAVNEAVRSHVAGELPLFEVEHRLRHKAGHWVWVLARGKVTRDAEGHPIRATGTHEDISQRKRVAAEGAGLLRKIEELIGGLASRAGSEQGVGDVTISTKRGETRLSGRNREVLQLIASGATTEEIARELGISAATAATHRRNLMRKLGVKNKAQLIRYAIEHKIVAT